MLLCKSGPIGLKFTFHSRPFSFLEERHVRGFFGVCSNDRGAALDDNIHGKRWRDRQGVFGNHRCPRVAQRAFQGVCRPAAGRLPPDRVDWHGIPYICRYGYDCPYLYIRFNETNCATATAKSPRKVPAYERVFAPTLNETSRYTEPCEKRQVAGIGSTESETRISVPAVGQYRCVHTLSGKDGSRRVSYREDD